jgi:cytochrome P450
MSRSMFHANPPQHARLRSLVSRAFSARWVSQQRRYATDLIRASLAEFADRDTVELVSEFAVPLPRQMLSELLQVPRADRFALEQKIGDWLARLSDASIGEIADSTLASIDRSTQQLLDYWTTVVMDRRRSPLENDLLTELVKSETGAPRATTDEVAASLLLLYGAGTDTTGWAISNAVLALLRNRSQLNRLASDPSLDHSAVEEVLRYDGPAILGAGRVAQTAIELAGRTIPSGAVVIPVVAAANRDPARFERPDRLDLGRGDTGHLTFGAGIHRCLGAPFARLQVECAVTSLVRQFPQLELISEPQWESRFPDVHRLKKLDIAPGAVVMK